MNDAVKQVYLAYIPEKMPQTPHEQEFIICSFYKYVYETEDCTTFDEYIIKNNYDVRSFKEMANSNEFALDIFYQVRAVLAQRIERLWKEKKIGDRYATEFLSMYNPTYLELRKLMAKVSASANQTAKIVIKERLREQKQQQQRDERYRSSHPT